MKNLLALLLLTAALGCQKDNVDPDCVEKPGDERLCAFVYRPVCGCNGKTYGNACEAEAGGIVKYTEGECKSGK